MEDLEKHADIHDDGRPDSVSSLFPASCYSRSFALGLLQRDVSHCNESSRRVLCKALILAAEGNAQNAEPWLLGNFSLMVSE